MPWYISPSQARKKIPGVAEKHLYYRLVYVTSEDELRDLDYDWVLEYYDIDDVLNMWWPTGEEAEFTPEELSRMGYRRRIVSPIGIIIDVKLYPERAPAWVKGKEAWISVEAFGDLL